MSQVWGEVIQQLPKVRGRLFSSYLNEQLFRVEKGFLLPLHKLDKLQKSALVIATGLLFTFFFVVFHES